MDLSSLTDPLLLAGVTAGAAGGLLLVQARVQQRLLQRRIATGAGTIAIDPATGLFSAAAAWQCIRAEANRSARLGRPLGIWVGSAPDATTLDTRGRELAFAMPSGCTGVRIDRTRLCIVSCAEVEDPGARLPDLAWAARQIEPGDDAAEDVLRFLSEATRG